MPHQFVIPTPAEQLEISIDAGETTIFVGANGGGKTRLAVYIEQVLGLNAHRISAHRALNLNADVAKITENQALAGLRTGHASEDSLTRGELRAGSRWGSKNATYLLNDFDFIIQALFADQSKTSLLAYHRYKPDGEEGEAVFAITKFDRLNEIWRNLLPHRELHILGDDILVSAPGNKNKYKASEMSDGERAIFYMIGQALVAVENSVMIVDEPELHVHRSIMSKLWDEIEAVRPDCGFIFITHDLEFAAARAAQKYVIKNYDPAPTWEIEAVPEDTGFSEELTTLILGSRKPVLFVEGTDSSLDTAIYRTCYPEWTIISRSSCTEVIRSVVTMRRNADLTRITCSGVVDGDDYEKEDREYLEKLGISVLPVSEVENLILLPDVSRSIAKAEGYSGTELDNRLADLSSAIFSSLDTAEKIETVVVRYCQRRVDRMLKKIDLSKTKTINDLEIECTERTDALDIADIAKRRTNEIEEAIAAQNLPKLLAYYDNKQLLAQAAFQLKGCKLSAFKGWITRNLRNGSCPSFTDALGSYLPKLTAK